MNKLCRIAYNRIKSGELFAEDESGDGDILRDCGFFRREFIMIGFGSSLKCS
jgi:hypothetical protein